MQNQIPPKMQQIQISFEQLIEHFFMRFFNSLQMKMFVELFKEKESAEKVLTEVFDETMKFFSETVVAQIAQQDLTFSIEYKKAVSSLFEQTKGSILSKYSEEKKEEKKTLSLVKD